jgi:hypothetical protein
LIADGEQVDIDPSGGAWRVIEVPAVTSATVIQSPLGWLALSSIVQGGKAVTGYLNALYRSDDGVSWEALPLQTPEFASDLNGLAYGNGRYVITAGLSFMSSTDALTWTETEQGVDYSNTYRELAFVHGKFFAMGMRTLGVSDDGITWRNVPVGNLQARAIAYGNGRYVMVGSGAMQVSEDGETWQSVDVPCDLPGACGEDPSGGIFQGYHDALVFAEGKFYTGQLASADGVTWEAAPWADGASPVAYSAGHFFGALEPAWQFPIWTLDTPGTLRAVRPSALSQTDNGRRAWGIGHVDGPDLPTSVDVSFEDGLTCATAECVLLDNHLLLVPPLDQAPLPDRLARGADGDPLLSDECPISSQIFCDDYDARTGCECHPEAPYLPEYCPEVGQFQCAGAFTLTTDEWQTGSIAQAGCDCNFVDPNEPPSFADACDPAAPVCAAPLECLQIQVAGGGAPPEPTFMCSAPCTSNDECPTWTATGFCAGEVQLECVSEVCQPRTCERGE